MEPDDPINTGASSTELPRMNREYCIEYAYTFNRILSKFGIHNFGQSPNMNDHIVYTIVECLVRIKIMTIRLEHIPPCILERERKIGGRIGI